MARTIQRYEDVREIKRKFALAYDKLKRNEDINALEIDAKSGWHSGEEMVSTSSTRRKSPKAFVSASVIHVTMMLCLFALATKGSALVPMIFSQQPRLLQLTTPTCNFDVIQNELNPDVRLTIFRPNADLHTINAHWCSTIQQHALYSVDLFNYHHMDVNQSELLASHEECNLMRKYQRCQFGQLHKTDNGATTRNNMEVNWSYFSIGSTPTSATNCFLRETKVAFNVGLLGTKHLSSPAGK